MRRLLASLALLLTIAAPAANATPAPTSYAEFVGALHDHSGYSDGWPGTIPADYYASGKHFGLDFLSGSEHSDTADVPVTASDACLGATITDCIAFDGVNSLRKWQATLDQANAATDANFTGLRGFEWTSDRFGHINVYFSQNDSNAKIDGGYVDMSTFYNWLQRPVLLGGGADGLATFNHPGDKSLKNLLKQNVDEASINWNDFAYVASADDRMVGIEVFNDFKDYNDYYAHALDKGWHLGPVGAEDLHGTPDADGRNQWGGPQWAKTVILANDRSASSLKTAMYARRFYAIRNNRGPRLELSFSVEKQMMGSRITSAAGKMLHIDATTNRPGATVEIVTSQGGVVLTGVGSVHDNVPASPAQKYYFMRVKENGQWTGYSAPVWVTV